MAIGQFAYANHSTRFLACEPLSDQPFAVAGVPYDGVVTNRPGARFGPQAIRSASLMLCDGIHPVFDVSPLEHLGDALDMRLPNASPLDEVRRHIEAQAAGLMARHHCVFLGGDHSVTLSLLRAAHARHGGQPLALVHFDAHCDTWTDHFGEPSGHGTWTYEALQEGLVSAAHTVQMGIRSAGVRARASMWPTRAGRSSPRAPCGGWTVPACSRCSGPSASASASGPATSAWTSTAWTRPLHPAPARPSRAA
jgi:agmatinase